MHVKASDPVAKTLRAFIDDEEITNRCFEADDEAGYALVYKHNAEGKKYRDPNGDGAAWERLEGRIRIEARA